MRVRYFLVAAACALCLLALPQPPAPAETQVSVTQIDFEALRAEAKGALDALQQPHNSRMASVTSAAF
jgi:hypothetical protein